MFTAHVAALVLMAVVASALAAGNHPQRSKNVTLKALKGEHSACVNGRRHSLRYDVRQVDSAKIVDLDSDISHLEGITCDIDHTRLRLEFSSDVYAAEWLVKFHDWNDHFLVGGNRWNCSQITKGARKGGFILRRVVGSSESGRYLEVQTGMARYDEVYESADISFATQGACTADDDSKLVGASADKPVCLGYNTDCSSGTATQPIEFYSNQYLDVSCSDCYFDFEADVFVDVSISDWRVQKLQAGFRDVALNASVVIDAKAAAQWSVGLDKKLEIIATTYLLNFKVGVVPFALFFDVPVEVKGDLSFHAAADVTVGAKANLALGQATLQWDPNNHWSSNKPVPQLDVTPQFSTSANLNADASFSLVPTFNMHFDRVFTYNMVFEPKIQAQVAGSQASKQVCMDSSYSVDLTQEIDLDINIPWLNLHKDYQFGPTSLYSVEGKALPHTCVDL